jgi:hypothetical protein
VDAVNQPTAAPTSKVKAGTAAAAATILIVFIAGQLGLEVPPAAAAALTTLLGFAGGYLKTERSSWGAKEK